jgi:hypothetical protein
MSLSEKDRVWLKGIATLVVTVTVAGIVGVTRDEEVGRISGTTVGEEAGKLFDQWEEKIYGRPDH